MLKPAMVAVPLVGSRSVASIRRVVVFPAPFAPRRPKIFPGSQVRLILETALTKPRFLSRKVLVRFSATITVFGDYHGFRRVVCSEKGTFEKNYREKSVTETISDGIVFV